MPVANCSGLEENLHYLPDIKNQHPVVTEIIESAAA
jgi:hypothetical protein